MKIVKNISLLQVSGKIDCTIEFSVSFYIFQHWSKILFDTFFENVFLSVESLKTNLLDALKAWDYAQTIFYSEKRLISYIKAEQDTRKHIF